MNILGKQKSKIAEPKKEAKSSSAFSYSGTSLIRGFRRSEKAGDLVGNSQYVFLVDLVATKPGLRREVEKRYGVSVEAVNIIKQKGKTKRLGATQGRRSDFKKAMVTLKQGDKIDVV